MLRPASGLRGLIERAIVAHQPSRKVHRERYFYLVTAIRCHSNLLSSRHSLRFENQLFESIARAAKWNRAWLRDPLSWTAPDGNPNEQLRSLFNHLFVEYPVPDFLYQAALFDADEFFRLFIRLGRGQSVRSSLPKCGLAFTMTKAMARAFVQAPKHLHVLDAIGWAQIVGTGGSQNLAKQILDSNAWGVLCDPDNEELWFSFIRFMIRTQKDFDSANPVNHLTLGVDELQEIVAFLRQQCLRPAAEILGCRTINEEPLQPNLSFNERTLRSFRRLMRTWKTVLADRANSLTYRPRHADWPQPQPIVIQPVWLPSSIGGFRVDWLDGQVFTIDEILTVAELNAEGGIMKHCVASYASQVSNRHTTIWSLKVHCPNSKKRLLTIQVNPFNLQVVQMKGPRNRAPLELESLIVRKWIEKENLIC